MTPEWTNLLLACVVAVVGIVGRVAAYYDRRWRDHVEREFARHEKRFDDHEKRFDQAGQQTSDLADEVQKMPLQFNRLLHEYQRVDLCHESHASLDRRLMSLEQWRDRTMNRAESKR